MEGFGTSVILAEDFRKPACRSVRIPVPEILPACILCLHKTHNDQRPSDQLLQSSCAGRHGQHSISDVMSSTPSHSGGQEFCIFCKMVSIPSHNEHKQSSGGAAIPFVETDIVLDKEEHFVWEEGWPQRSGEVDVF